MDSPAELGTGEVLKFLLQQPPDSGRPSQQASLKHHQNLPSLQLYPSFGIETLLHTRSYLLGGSKYSSSAYLATL